MYGGRDFLESGVEETDYEESDEEKEAKKATEAYCTDQEVGRCNILFNQGEGRRGILGGMNENRKGGHSHVSNILLASLIHRLVIASRGERERLFGSQERERKLKITFPFYGKGTGIRKCYGKGMGNLRLVFPGIPGNPGNHIKSKVKFKI